MVRLVRSRNIEVRKAGRNTAPARALRRAATPWKGALHECYDEALLIHQKKLLLEKWRSFGEDAIADYLEQTKFNRRFSRCHSVPGEATDTCSLEAFHGKTLKAAGGFESLEGLGSGIQHSLRIMARISL